VKIFIGNPKANSLTRAISTALRLACAWQTKLGLLVWDVLFVAIAVTAALLATSQATGQTLDVQFEAHGIADHANRPPRVLADERFLAKRGWTPGNRIAALHGPGHGIASRAKALARTQGALAGTPITATWQPLGPTAFDTLHLAW